LELKLLYRSKRFFTQGFLFFASTQSKNGGILLALTLLMKIYLRYPAFWTFLAYASGIALSLYLPLLSLFFFLLPATIFRKTPIFLLAFVTLGGLRGYSYMKDYSRLKDFVGRRIEAEIVVKRRGVGRIRSIKGEGKVIHLNGTVFLKNSPPILPGSRIRVKGRLRAFKGSRYTTPLERSGSFLIQIEEWEWRRDWFAKRREEFLAILEDLSWCDANRSLLLAFLGGLKTRLGREVEDAFKRCGIYHLLALSGLHLGILAGIIGAILILLRVPLTAREIIVVAILVFYVKLVGSRPSLVRALILTVVFVIALSLRRRHLSINALGVAGFFSLFFNPSWLFNLGFQLSYLATFGILALFPIIAKIRVPKILRYPFYSLLVSLSAQIFTTPLLLFTFGWVSPLGLFFNLVFVPLLALILTESILSLLFYLTPLRFPLLGILNALIFIFYRLLMILQDLPLPILRIKLSLLPLVLLYSFLIGGSFAFHYFKK
jgi:ComEC/Rec2-related protein